MAESPRMLKQYYEDGNDLYQYMYSQFHDELKDCYQLIKYFEIRDFPNMAYIRLDEVRILHQQMVQPEVLQWIRKERDLGRLFHKTNWRIYPEACCYGHSYIGYKFLVPYCQYYFQLTVDFFYNCKHEPYEDGNELHFQLSLYGWNEENSRYVQPDNKYTLSDDLSIPEYNEYTYSLE